MKNFKKAYKEAVDSIPVPGFCTEEISEENQIKKTLLYRRKRHAAAAAFAGGIFVIFTLGGVAAGYARNPVQADENGFQTMDINIASAQDEMQEAVMPAGGIVMERMAGIQDSEGGSGDTVSEDLIYTSLNAFEEAQDIPLALPDTDLMGELKREEYILTKDGFLSVCLETEESILLLHQSYCGSTSESSSAAAYTDEAGDERNYTTGQGFSYEMTDTSDGEEMHVSITVGGYELILDFYGYTKEEVYEVLEDMDLSVYFYIENYR